MIPSTRKELKKSKGTEECQSVHSQYRQDTVKANFHISARRNKSTNRKKVRKLEQPQTINLHKHRRFEGNKLMKKCKQS